METNITEIKFGTDGWRAVIGGDYTFKNLRIVSQAVSDYFGPAKLVAIGYDTRFMSDRFALFVSEIFKDNGISVILSDRPIPTPALSFAVKNRCLDLGIMITASHNPPEYNGFKIKTSSGGAAGIELTSKIEELISKPLGKQINRIQGKIDKINLCKEYVSFLRSYVHLKRLKNTRLKILVDAMYGSGNGFIAEVLRGTDIKLEFIRTEVNPSFGGLNPEPISENLGPTIERMKKERFNLCLVLDGDADRIACLTGDGDFISPQKILGLLVLHLFQDRKMTGGVVKTIVGTNLIDNITKKLGLKLYETPVGFKHISNLMEKEDILVGGEEAGGIGFKGYIPERDGILAGLLLLEMMVFRKKPMIKIIDEMEREFGRYYYLRQDLDIANLKIEIQNFKKIKNILGIDVVKIKDYDGIKLICKDQSWLMFRTSGTEPIVRVYAESKSLNKTKKMLKFGKDLIFKVHG